MAFENSPKLGDKQGSTSTISGKVYKIRRALMIVVAVMLALNIVFLTYRIAPSILLGAPGGLDGCVVTTNGNPVAATVWVDDESQQTYADGCFFFSSVLPGKHQFRVDFLGETRHEQSIQILSGQALGLGTIQIAP